MYSPGLPGQQSYLVVQPNQVRTHHQNGLGKHQLRHQHNKELKINAVSSIHPSSQFFFQIFLYAVCWIWIFILQNLISNFKFSLSLSFTHTHTHIETLSSWSTSKSWPATQGHALYKFNHSTTIASRMSPSVPLVSRSSSRYIYWYSYLGFGSLFFYLFILHVFDNLSMCCLRKWMKECWAKW